MLVNECRKIRNFVGSNLQKTSQLILSYDKRHNLNTFGFAIKMKMNSISITNKYALQFPSMKILHKCFFNRRIIFEVHHRITINEQTHIQLLFEVLFICLQNQFCNCNFGVAIDIFASGLGKKIRAQAFAADQIYIKLIGSPTHTFLNNQLHIITSWKK